LANSFATLAYSCATWANEIANLARATRESRQPARNPAKIEQEVLQAYHQRVTRPSQTYLLTLNRRQFEALTHAIMLESNKIGKLQGFGQCVAAWLRAWDQGELNSITTTKPPKNTSAKPQSGHRLYVALNHDSTKLLKRLQDQLRTESANPVTIPNTLMTLVACIMDKALAENACAKP
jgi:hypothetical protein